jgi:hypothetical protein
MMIEVTVNNPEDSKQNENLLELEEKKRNDIMRNDYLPFVGNFFFSMSV